jgi:flagellar assembly factor FliW
MFITTRDFGRVEVKPHDIVHFVQPIFGFEGLSQYVMIQDKAIGQQFVWLQSIESHDVCFILIDPAMLAKKYPPAWSEDIVQLLRKYDMQQSKCWNIAVIPEAFKDTTINLKSPVLIDPEQKKRLAGHPR